MNTAPRLSFEILPATVARLLLDGPLACPCGAATWVDCRCAGKTCGKCGQHVEGDHCKTCTLVYFCQVLAEVAACDPRNWPKRYECHGCDGLFLRDELEENEDGARLCEACR